MQSSESSVRRSRGEEVERRLAIVAIIVWVLAVLLLFWADQNRLAPPEGLVLAVGLAAFVLAAVVMPFAMGAYVAWRRRGHAHRVLAGAGAAMLAEWAFFLMFAIHGLVFDPQRIASYFNVDMMVEWGLVLLVFGVDGVVMGAVGGAVTAFVQRRLALGGALPGGG